MIYIPSFSRKKKKEKENTLKSKCFVHFCYSNKHFLKIRTPFVWFSGLADCWGEEFEKLYMKYEAEGKYRKKVKAQDLWKAIVESQIETGTPYMLYKDACNRKSNQQNLGTIKCSNLCTEIVEYSSADEVNPFSPFQMTVKSCKEAQGKKDMGFIWLNVQAGNSCLKSWRRKFVAKRNIST